MDTEMLTASEAATLLHIDTSTLRRWRDAGRLKGVTMQKTEGGHYRYDRAGIEAVASRQMGADGAAPTALAEAPAAAPLAVPTINLPEPPEDVEAILCPACKNVDMLRPFCKSCEDTGHLWTREVTHTSKRVWWHTTLTCLFAVSAFYLVLMVCAPFSAEIAVQMENAFQAPATEGASIPKLSDAEVREGVEAKTPQVRSLLGIMVWGVGLGVTIFMTMRALRVPTYTNTLTEWAPAGQTNWRGNFSSVRPMIGQNANQQADGSGIDMVSVAVGMGVMAILDDDDDS